MSNVTHIHKKEADLPFFEFKCIAHMVHDELKIAFGDSPSRRDQYLLDNFLSKYNGPSEEVTAQTRANAAFQGFLEDEKHNLGCFERVLFPIGELSNGITHQALLHTASRLIADLIGPFTYDVYRQSAFTGGASVGFPKAKLGSQPHKKYAGRVTCTRNAKTRVQALISCTPLWKQFLSEKYGESPDDWVEVVPGSIGFTAPKNSKTDRFCAKEPSGNMALQKGVGVHFRNSLRTVGINLRDQSKNRRAAFKASIDGEDATLDEKSASNSTLTVLCYQLFSQDWFRELTAIRSPRCKVSPDDDTYHSLEMISSMGNGFTFELESLIFWALCTSVVKLSGFPGRVLVYGDDIVVRSVAAPLVIEGLSYCGYRTNHSKSFWTGDFRESCGGHYINGLDVTPIYVKDPINDTSRVLWLLNSLRKWGDIGGIVDDRLWPLYRKIQRRYVNRQLWGGKRLSSITSLATPHKPWKAFDYRVLRKRTLGVPGLLRYFQYRITKDDIGGRVWDDRDITTRIPVGSSPGLTPVKSAWRGPVQLSLIEEVAQLSQYRNDMCHTFGVNTPEDIYDLLGETQHQPGLAFICQTSKRPIGLRANEVFWSDEIPVFLAEIQ